MRNLVIVFGDQLSHKLSAFDDFNKSEDRIWMAEVEHEAKKTWSHKLRLAFFFSAMRHFRDELREKDFQVEYHALEKDLRKSRDSSFTTELEKTLDDLSPEKIVITRPGDWFVLSEVESFCEKHELDLEVREDKHFYCSVDEFSEWSSERKGLVLENFYRWMRKKHRVLMTKDDKPVGGDWNFDQDNRGTFGKSGPEDVPEVKGFEPDEITQEVIEMVEHRFEDHPGSCDHFAYPVTASQAKESLKDFIQNRLPRFGEYQDAMWTDTEFLYHSRISAVLNVHLLEPFDAVNAAIDAYEDGNAPINSVEGFVRQIIGWREFVRGIYWTLMPDYIERNELECDDLDVPSSFWDGQTEMNCVKESMKPVLQHAYAHHIQRLMVLGLYAQLLGVHPRKFHDWHMAMYADAIDWVSLPNTLGMSQHGDGGVVGTKPYCASGNYINKMSNYCKSCRFDPKKSVGEDACPVTTMYWDFLDRHQKRFSKNRRMVFQIKNLEKKDPDDLKAILKQAKDVRKRECGKKKA